MLETDGLAHACKRTGEEVVVAIGDADERKPIKRSSLALGAGARLAVIASSQVP